MPRSLLLGVVVGRRSCRYRPRRAVLGAGVEQHPLGDRRLAGVDVGDDADVADFGQIGGPWTMQ